MISHERDYYHKGERDCRKETVQSRSSLVGDEQIFQPVMVQRFEFDREFAMSQITKETCGEVENRVESDKLADVTIEGIVSKEQARLLKNLHRQNRLLLTSEKIGRAHV